MLRLAIDTGGTFTDCVLQDDASGEVWLAKTLSIPDAPHRAVGQGIEVLAKARAFGLHEVGRILIATTVATNAILERAGARVGLITTRGFRDVALLGRAKRYDTYDLHLDKPIPLVQRRAIVEVDERVGANGEVVRALDVESVHAGARALAREEVEAVAVCLINAYANPIHERAIGEVLGQVYPELDVSLSSEVSPKYREYERTSTTLANAYVKPTVARYLDRLADAFGADGFRGELLVMQSNGGLLTPALARAFPANIIESGPAAGTLLGGVVGRREGLAQVLTFDMGGTTAKVGAVEDGEPAVTSTFEVDGINLRQWSGLPLNISAVELIEIGAGGGSIADAQLGVIRVGPRSAGAQPGPVCYAQGGREPTITDANLVLGYLVADRFAAGTMSLDVEAARDAIERAVAKPLGLDVHEAAWGIHTMANLSMERAMRSMSIERGRDPRDFAMVAFGGAGPVHACRLARVLGIGRVIVPWGAGVGSAIGMLAAAPRIDVSLTRILRLETSALDEIGAVFADLDLRVARMSRRAPAESRRYVSVRYLGQGYELRVEVPGGAVDGSFLGEVEARFYAAYEQAYGYAERGKALEATDWQVVATLAAQDDVHPEVVRTRPSVASETQMGASASHRAYFPAEEGGRRADFMECPVRERAQLIGRTITGPAIIAEPETTVLIPPGDVASINASDDLVVTIAGDGER